MDGGRSRWHQPHQVDNLYIKLSTPHVRTGDRHSQQTDRNAPRQGEHVGSGSLSPTSRATPRSDRGVFLARIRGVVTYRFAHRL